MKRVCCLILAVLLLGGCRPQGETGGQVIVTGVGVESQNGSFRLSVQAIEALRIGGSLSEQNEPATAVYTAEGASVAEALQAFLNETGKRAYILQNQLLAVGLEQCRNTVLSETLDYFMRNREGHSQVQLVVCRGEVAPLLDITVGNDAVPAEYVSKLLIEGERLSQCVTAQLLDVERDLSGTLDAAIPILEVRDHTPQLSGTALFRGGRLLGELTNRETTALLLAAGEGETCLYTHEGITYRLEDIRSRIEVLPLGEGFEYRVGISAVSRTVERAAQSAAPSLAAAATALENEIGTALTRTVRELHADPLGLSRRTAACYRQNGVTQDAARKALPNALISVTVTLTHADNGFMA